MGISMMASVSNFLGAERAHVGIIRPTHEEKLCLTVVEDYGLRHVDQYIVNRASVFDWEWVLSANLDIDVSGDIDDKTQSFIHWMYSELTPTWSAGPLTSRPGNVHCLRGANMHTRVCRLHSG